MFDRWRSLRHVGPALAVAMLAASLLVGPTSHDASPAAANEAVSASANSVAQAATCVQATNRSHASAGRATRWLVFVWAKGSNTYLGTLLTTTSLREGPAGTWTRVENCDATPPPTPGWPHVGLNLENTRAATETAITPANAATLGRAWQLAGVEGVTGTPIVANGVLYVGDWTGHLRALDATTGQERWSSDLGSQIPGAVAMDDSRVFAGTWDGRLIARNRSTGATAWEVSVDPHEVAVVYGSPVYVDGKVIVGVSSDEWWEGDGFTFRGSVVAYDAATGNEVWRYWTTCGPENAGRNNCPANGPTEGAGVGVWAYPAVDVQRGLVYFGTGNHHGPPTTGRSDALIAVDLDTGQERWVSQFTAGDYWNLPGQGDPDSGVGPDADVMVASLFRVGNVDAVGVGDKDGTYKALNRENGQVLWSQKLTEGSIQGGVMASAAIVTGDPATPNDDRVYLTANRGGQNADLVALNATDGNVVTRVDLGGSVVSPVTWANGLIFVASNGGWIRAFDTTNGLRQAWTWPVAAPAAGGISVVNGIVYGGWGWALNGESSAGGLLAFRLGGEPPDPIDPPPDGAAVYAQNCAACHGADGSGGAGPTLLGIGETHTTEELTAVVTNGRGAMPAWRDQLSAEEIAAVVAYIETFEGDGHEHEH